MDRNAERPPVILFDGVCMLCNKFVQFVIKNDPKEKFRFAALQSEFASTKLKDLEYSPDLSTVILWDREGALFTKSAAALRIAGELRFPFNLLSFFKVLPVSILDRIYDWVATNRYKWFGKLDTCVVPSPELKSRFLK